MKRTPLRNPNDIHAHQKKTKKIKITGARIIELLGGDLAGEYPATIAYVAPSPTTSGNTWVG
jgi:hypothetical protein